MMNWDIRADGRAWRDEAMDRYARAPETREMIGAATRRIAALLLQP